ncbi:MAG: LemA family protein [Prevotella sp.]|nr:LemA family protein [Prevotella sp.]
METWVIILIVVGVVVVGCVGYVISTQRSLVSLDEFCKNALGQIEVQLNSRWDALLALAQSAARYSKFEAETMMQVIRERRVAGVSTAGDVQAQQSDMQGIAAKLMAVGEAYPELKSAELYAKTMDGVNKYEDHVRMARMVYNDTATKMNRMVRQFPSSIVASMLGFGLRDYLKADDAQKKSYPNIKDAYDA